MAAKEPRPGAEELVEAARRLYRESGEPMTLKAFAQRSGYKASQVDRLFSGGWTELRERAGVPAHPRTPRRYSDDDLLEEFHELRVES